MALIDVLGSGRGRSGGSAMSPVRMAVLGLLAYRTLKGKGRLAGVGGTAGGLGGLLGGGALSGGLKDLIDRFKQTGQEQKAQSWISTGANHSIEPHELEQVLGEERINWLVEETGMARDQLLAKLSGELPAAVDELTRTADSPRTTKSRSD